MILIYKENKDEEVMGIFFTRTLCPRRKKKSSYSIFMAAISQFEITVFLSAMSSWFRKNCMASGFPTFTIALLKISIMKGACSFYLHLRGGKIKIIVTIEAIILVYRNGFGRAKICRV